MVRKRKQNQVQKKSNHPKATFLQKESTKQGVKNNTENPSIIKYIKGKRSKVKARISSDMQRRK